MVSKRLGLLLLIIMLGSFSIAQEIQDSLSIYDLSLEDLSKVSVFSASRTQGEEAGSAPANILVINKAQIEERGYRSLVDIFEGLPDFKVDRGVDPRWFNDVTVRGVRYSDKLIILLDGVRISSPTNEITSIFENYPLYMAEQVEIVYGPSSALYGADAFNGVVNIVTKKPTLVPSLQGSVTGGMYGLFDSNLFLTQKIKDWDFSVGGHFFHDKQPDLSDFYPKDFEGLHEQLAQGTFNTSTGVVTPSASVDAERGNPLSANSIYGKVAYKNVSLSYFQNNGRNPSSAANTPNNSVYNKEQYIGHNIRMITAKYTTKLANHLSTSQVTFSRYKLDPESNFRNVFTAMEPAYLYSRSWKFKVEQLFVFQLSKRLKLTSGVTYERFHSTPRTNDLTFPVLNNRIKDATIVNSIAPNNLNGIPAELISTDYNNVGGLSQLMWQNEKWDFVIGVRADKDERYDLTINPRAGIVARPTEKLTLKGLFGTAYLAPSPQNIYDRFGKFETSDGGNTYFTEFFQLPNPNLKPQTIATAELNGKYFINPSFCIDVSVYRSSVMNSISPINSETNRGRIEEIYPNLTYVHNGVAYQIDSIQIHDNLGESNIYGGSVTINYLWRANPYLSGDFYIISSFVGGHTDVDEEGPLEKRNLPGVSTNITHLGATLRSGKFTMHTRLSLFSAQRTIGVGTVQNIDNDGNRFNDVEYQEVDGYHRLDLHLIYQLNDKVSFTLNGRNMTNQKYRNVSIGSAPEGATGLGSGVAEFMHGVPQNPLRITGGINFKL